MKIKFNWGTGIVLTLIMIVLFMSTLVYIATKQDFYLVDEDYYERGVKYQDQIEKRKNAKQLSTKVQIVQLKENIEVSFPDDSSGNEIIGTLHFYSPVDKSLDFKTKIKANKKLKQNINISNLKKGRYIVKIDWESANKTYYHEQNLIVR